jgi:hypothetical protein
MPSSSDHDTDKERKIIGTFIRAHVRLTTAFQHDLSMHLLVAMATVLEVEADELEDQLYDIIGSEMVADEEARIARWKGCTEGRLILSAAEIVEDVARDVVGSGFGKGEQMVLFELAGEMIEVAQEVERMERRRSVEVILVD